MNLSVDGVTGSVGPFSASPGIPDHSYPVVHRPIVKDALATHDRETRPTSTSLSEFALVTHLFQNLNSGKRSHFDFVLRIVATF